MSLSVGSVTFSDPTAGFHATAGLRVWDDFIPDSPDVALERIKQPAGDGCATRDQGFAGRRILFSAFYTGETATACMSALYSDITALVATPVTITTPDGGSYPACYLVTMKPQRSPKYTGHSTYMMRVLCAFDQHRLA